MNFPPTKYDAMCALAGSHGYHNDESRSRDYERNGSDMHRSNRTSSRDGPVAGGPRTAHPIKSDWLCESVSLVVMYITRN